MILSISKERQQIADSILDSVYQKLFEANSTRETIRQMMIDAGLDNKNWNPEHFGVDWNSGRRYLVGKLIMKITEDFLETEKYDFQTFYNAINILLNLEDKNLVFRIKNKPFLSDEDNNMENCQEAEYAHCVYGYMIGNYYQMNLVIEYAINIVMGKITKNKPRFLEYLTNSDTPFVKEVAKGMVIIKAMQSYPKFKELIEYIEPSYRFMNPRFKELFEMFNEG